MKISIDHLIDTFKNASDTGEDLRDAFGELIQLKIDKNKAIKIWTIVFKTYINWLIREGIADFIEPDPGMLSPTKSTINSQIKEYIKLYSKIKMKFCGKSLDANDKELVKKDVQKGYIQWKQRKF